MHRRECDVYQCKCGFKLYIPSHYDDDKKIFICVQDVQNTEINME